MKRDNILLETIKASNAFLKILCIIKKMEDYGLKLTPNEGRNLTSNIDGICYARYPVVTPTVKIGDDLYSFIERYGKPYFQSGDIFCVSAKVVSICEKYVLHRSQVKESFLAKFIVRFVTKWPDDIGYSHPRKMQAAIDIVGYPRIIIALIGGTLLKFLGKPGYFYRIAGHNINAIDGFNPVSKPPMDEYAVLPPPNGDAVCDRVEAQFGMPTVILDGNNIDNNILGMSKQVKHLYSAAKFMEIVEGNPQGQEDDGAVTPILIVRKLSETNHK